MQHKIIYFLKSRRFLWLIVAIFAFESTWIALTGRYPGAFDENFHFGLIQLYAKHWLPFIDSQPPNAEVYGAVARDPSYLYHYLMSFPYRLITVFTHSQPAQIIALRLLNVALAIWGVLVYAQILRRTKLSALAQHAILLLFVSVPILPLLAGQINYDNLLLVLGGYAILWTVQSLEYMKQSLVSGRLILQILIVSMIACLTKYAFLPIVAGIVIFLGVQMYMQRKRLFPEDRVSYLLRARQATRKWSTALLLLLLLVVGGLFWQRFGINMLRYHAPVPDCSQVITVDECLSYAPWQRDYAFAQNNTDWKRESIIVYGDMWVHQMVREMYFSVYGAFFPGTSVVDYKVAEPLPIMIILGWTLLLTGIMASVVYARSLWSDPRLQLFAVIIVLYVAALFYQNRKAYIETAVPVAIHGRYLLPILPLMGVIYFRAFSLLLRDIFARQKLLAAHRTAVLLGCFALLVLTCLQGGGIITHIVRSNSDWFWQESPAAQQSNSAARNLLRPLVIENKL